MIENIDIKKRILQISYEKHLSHIGSCLCASDILVDIFKSKKPAEKFVLSQGHAGLALYVVLEEKYGYDAESLLEACGIHPDRLQALSCVDCSTGSLGQGLPIALGMALADRTKNVYCLISDGELSEGSVWESLLIAKKMKVDNLKIYVNWNGYGGYGETDSFIHELLKKFATEVHITPCKTNVDYLPFLSGLKGHYHTMSEDDYNLAMETLK